MRRIIIIFSQFLAFISVAQQSDDLFNNKSITWIAEGYHDYITESVMDKGDSMNLAIPLKFINKQEDKVREDVADRFFTSILLNAINEGKVPIYKDEKCNILIDRKSLITHDTFVICFPEDDYKGPGYGLVSTIPETRQILFFRLYQTYYYDSSKSKFLVRNNALALMQYAPYDIEPIKHEPLCWVKVKNLTKPYNLKDKKITWAAKITGDRSKIRLLGKDKNVKDLKNGNQNPIKQYLEDLRKKTSISIFNNDNLVFENPLQKDKRDNLISEIERIDTVYNGLSFVQKWYWNSKKQQLEIYLTAVGIRASFFNEEGVYKYNAPLFYRRND